MNDLNEEKKLVIGQQISRIEFMDCLNAIPYDQLYNQINGDKHEESDVVGLE